MTLYTDKGLKSKNFYKKKFIYNQKSLYIAKDMDLKKKN